MTHFILAPDGTKLKRCEECLEYKPLDAFAKNKTTKCGLRSNCKVCHTKSRKQTERTCEFCGNDFNVFEDQVKFGRGRFCSRSCRSSAIMRAEDRFSEEEKSACRRETRRFIYNNPQVKPSNCSSCGTLGVVSAHHVDYSNWALIQWLCAECHRRLHLGQEIIAPIVNLSNCGVTI